jgi:hypothetical protein
MDSLLNGKNIGDLDIDFVDELIERLEDRF